MAGRTKIEDMLFSRVYPMLVSKAERKGRTKEETDALASWLTGWSPAEIASFSSDMTYGDFFRNAPKMNPLRFAVKGKICGVRVEEIEDPLMRDIRILDKLVDDLAKGKPEEKILPQEK